MNKLIGNGSREHLGPEENDLSSSDQVNDILIIPEESISVLFIPCFYKVELINVVLAEYLFMLYIGTYSKNETCQDDWRVCFACSVLEIDFNLAII